MIRFLGKLLIRFGYGLVFSLIGALAVYIYLNTRFTAEPWHTVALHEEFTADTSASVPDFDSYRKLEKRLFSELREKVYQTDSGPGSLFNRYARGSLSDPTMAPTKALTSTSSANWPRFSRRPRRIRVAVMGRPRQVGSVGHIGRSAYPEAYRRGKAVPFRFPVRTGQGRHGRLRTNTRDSCPPVASALSQIHVTLIPQPMGVIPSAPGRDGAAPTREVGLLWEQ